MSYATDHRAAMCRRDVRRHHNKLKQVAFDHYGRACVLCGYDDTRALTLDHVNGDGNKDKGKSCRKSTGLYRHVIKQGLPSIYRTLCMNCQWITRHQCVHSNV